LNRRRLGLQPSALPGWATSAGALPFQDGLWCFKVFWLVLCALCGFCVWILVLCYFGVGSICLIGVCVFFGGWFVLGKLAVVTVEMVDESFAFSDGAVAGVAEVVWGGGCCALGERSKKGCCKAFWAFWVLSALGAE
jgi:hypothetical protein